MYNVPEPAAEFTGRIQELSFLQKSIYSHTVIVIAGIGGIGKTALASCLAQKLDQEPDFNERILWLNCLPGWNASDLQSAIFQAIIDFTGLEDLKKTSGRDSDHLARLCEDCAIILVLNDLHHVSENELTGFVRSCMSFFRNARLLMTIRERPAFSRIELAELVELRLTGLSTDNGLQLVSGILASHNVPIPDHDFLTKACERFSNHPLVLKMFASAICSGELDESMETASFSKVCAELCTELITETWNQLSPGEKEA